MDNLNNCDFSCVTPTSNKSKNVYSLSSALSKLQKLDSNNKS